MMLMERCKVTLAPRQSLPLERVSTQKVLIALCIASLAIFANAQTNAGDINMVDQPTVHQGDEPVIAHSKTPGICLFSVGQRSYPVPYPVVLTGTRSEVTAMVDQGMLDARSCAAYELQNLKTGAKSTSLENPKMRWKTGSNDELAWVQYVAQETNQPVASFFRWVETQKVEIRIHGPDPEAAINQEVPRFAAFTLRTGQGKRAITLEGIGQVARDDEGNLVFSSKHAADSKNIERVRRFIGRVGKFMTLSMESVSLKLPVDKRTKHALQSLFSK